MPSPEDKRRSLPEGVAPATRSDGVVVTHTGGSGVRPDPGDRGSVWALGTQFSSYEIESLLASGGMAEVWRAKINGLEGFEKRIVIKTMLTQYQDRSDLIEMFVSEASLAARLSHPNVVDVIDFGQLDGRYFIAMEYVPGMTLRFAQKRARTQGRRLPVAALLHVARDVCEALQYIHELEDASGEMGLVHRDLSPDNIIVATSGTTKLIDFGTARATARTPPSTAFVGKFRYAAPERIRQEGEDRRSDIYSLGVILYECLVGVRPFDGSDADVIRAVTSSVACDPSIGSADVMPSVAELVKKATAGNPAHRFASAQAMGTALARCLSEMGATNKERAVTAALATLLEEEAVRPRLAATLDTLPAVPEAVPQPIGAREPSESGDIGVVELEIIEASGPIQPVEPMPAADTERISITLPPEAFPPPHAETIRKPRASSAPSAPIQDGGDGARWDAPPGAPGSPANLDDAIRGALAGSGATRLRSWRRAAAATHETTHSDWAVAVFDQGLELRLEGRYEEALEAWELALRLAPENHLYQAHVNKLRAQLQSRRLR
jgi:serine/threonine protein kinase